MSTFLGFFLLQILEGKAQQNLIGCEGTRMMQWFSAATMTHRILPVSLSRFFRGWGGMFAKRVRALQWRLRNAVLNNLIHSHSFDYT